MRVHSHTWGAHAKQNWANEFTKWLGPGKVSCLVMEGGSKSEIKQALTRWIEAEGTSQQLQWCEQGVGEKRI